MKLATVTFQDSKNIGAILQAFALARVLNSRGAETEILDYECAYLRARENPFSIKNNGAVRAAASLLYFPVSAVKSARIAAFEKKYFPLGKTRYSRGTVARAAEEYDGFVAGSDQIWNAALTGGDRTYLLDFAGNKKRFAYAASFGGSGVPDEARAEYAALLSDFDGLSVREQSACAAAEELSGKPVRAVLDPTLLLPGDEWRAMARPVKRGKYVLLYLMQKNRDIIDFAAGIAKERSAELLMINEGVRYGSGLKYIRGAGPEEWLSYMCGAECVVTNSFHGTAFSANLNKEFYTGLLPGGNKVNARLSDLLALLGLENRIIGRDNSPADWDKVNAALSGAREGSLSFIDGMLGEAK